MITNIEEEFWLDRAVFVTGGTGLLGSCLIKSLLKVRADVVCLIRDWVPQSELILSDSLESVKVVRGDVRHIGLIERVMGEYEIDTVFHLAAQTTVPVANRNPISTFETNIGGTWNVLEAARRSPTVKQLVLASSDKAYGEQGTLPYTEDMPIKGSHPYDVSKSCADLIAKAYATTFSLPVAITRCGNLFGEGDLNWNRIIPGTIRSVLREKRPIIRSNGQNLRDYFYIEDAASAYIITAQKLAESKALIGEAFNFSYERPMAVLSIVKLLLSLMRSELEPEILGVAKGEIRDQYLNAEKARRMIGWKPSYSLDDGLKRTINWYRKLLGANK